ncbi:MAG: hypothetical protein ACPIOQ_57610, partial [Promethearchaeia archaeon]
MAGRDPDPQAGGPNSADAVRGRLCEAISGTDPLELGRAESFSSRGVCCRDDVWIVILGTAARGVKTAVPGRELSRFGCLAEATSL